MPKSPCSECGKLTLHTDDDARPLCEKCEQKAIWDRIIWDVLEERVDGEQILKSLKEKG